MASAKFLIKPIHENALEMYSNHSTYHSGDAGLDLFIMEDCVINSGKTALVDLGIQCQLSTIINDDQDRCIAEPLYYSYLLFPRSSMSKTPLRLANSIGLIDAGYRGNIKVALWNTSDEDFIVKKGERYVQLVKADLSGVSFEIVDELIKTERDVGGFGSTGQ